MANRVVTGPLPGGGIGLRVSRPGYNVLDAGIAPKGVAFDSRWSRAGRIHMTGVVTGSTTISFGKTFPVCPLVYIVFTDAQGRYRSLSTYGQYSDGNLLLRTTTSSMTFGLTADMYPATYVVVAL